MSLSNKLSIKKVCIIVLSIILIEFISSIFIVPLLITSDTLDFKSLLVINFLRSIEFLTIIIFMLFVWKGSYKDIGFYTENLKNDLKWAVYFIFGLGAIVIAIELCVLWIARQDLFLYLVDNSLPMHDKKYMMLYFFTIIITASIMEELIFRQIVYGNLRVKFNVFFSIILTSCIFAFLHFNEGLYVIIPLTGGILFAILHEITGNIIASTILHAAGNLTLTMITIVYRWNDYVK
ncbi:CPBP family intramembrane metalloprotease [Candidatus Poribacteria bacterium]|nr:CPBP family intramembrane metalloprotease [Candidatus Poribacteria bacterium]